MRVLYLGATDPASTSRHRADALRRIGCEVLHIEPFDAVRAAMKGLQGALHYRTGYLFTHARLANWLSAQLHGQGHFDLCWVDSGELISKAALDVVRQSARRIVLFNHDDPTGPRDRLRFQTLRRAIPSYDLCLAVRDINVPEFRHLGARDVLKIWRSYDEVAHRPRDASAPVAQAYRNDIVFIGRQMDGEGRDLLMQHLIRNGLRPAIWGDNWQRSSIWSELEPYWKGYSLSGQDYVDAIRGASICLGMLSKGNRDHHTTRTMEIPVAGGLFCAERTQEHLALYRDGVEAAFWSSPDECVEVCKALLAHPPVRESIRQAGQRRVLNNRVGNEDICRAVLDRLGLIRQAA